MNGLKRLFSIVLSNEVFNKPFNGSTHLYYITKNNLMSLFLVFVIVKKGFR